MVDQMELLRAAQAHDAKAVARNVNINKAIISAGTQEVTPPVPVHELVLTTADDEDPFGGNINNRKVAERIALQKSRLFLNSHRVTHTGDPQKALADVAKSKTINPDSLSEQELEQAQQQETARKLAAKKPSAGSPAESRLQAEDRAKSAANVADVEVGRQTPSPAEANETSVVDRGVHETSVGSSGASGVKPTTPNGPPAWKPNAGPAAPTAKK